MTQQCKTRSHSPLLIPSSYLTTESNKTGSWRFLRPRYDEKTAPCSASCPAGEDIARIEMLTTQGLFKEAWETILTENPFPAVCGRVCYHPCESVCNRREFDEAIAIHTIERFLADTASRYDLKAAPDRMPSNGRKTAIIGAGPAGLAAAYFLTRLGYACDVFEAMPEPGGVLRWGIPPYRLPVDVLRKEIDQIREVGFTIHCGTPISQGFIREAKGRYDAVFLGCGYSHIPNLNVPGEDVDGVVDGLSFLQSIRRGEPPVVRGPVAVIGGGNTAIDVARTVLRLGGRAILAYRRRREDMPAFQHEIEMASEEGVQFLELMAPIRIEREGGTVRLHLQCMQAAGVDPEGRTRVEVIPGKTESIEVSQVIRAIGLEAAEKWVDPPSSGTTDEGEMLRLGQSVLFRPNGGPPIIFTGDLTAKTKSVVDAVASAKEGAIALDIMLKEGFDAVRSNLDAFTVGGGPSLSMEIYMQGPRCRRSSHVVHYDEINSDYFQLSPRITQPRLLREERVRSMAEIDLKVSANLAMREAERCFNCGLCNQCDNCRLFCPDLSIDRDETTQARHINYDYCKGCGICVVECPRNAMSLTAEGLRAED